MDELYHFGIKGMKWGVRRYQNKDNDYKSASNKSESNKSSKNRLAEIGWASHKGISVAYNAVNKHGQKTLQKQAERYEYRSQAHRQKGHKIRAAYYDRKSYKALDKQYDDIAAVYEGIKDIGMKTAAVANAARIGASVVSNILENRRYNKELEERKKMYGAQDFRFLKP